MIGSAVTFSAVSIGIFILMLIVVHQEKRRGKRFAVAGGRASLDRFVSRAEHKIVRTWNHFVKYVVQLNWYYSIHSILKTLLHAVQVFYFSFEKIFERNRARTKKLRAERRQINQLSHLSQLAEHKEEMALTETQKRQLRHKKLEETH